MPTVNSTIRFISDPTRRHASCWLCDTTEEVAYVDIKHNYGICRDCLEPTLAAEEVMETEATWP